MICITCVHFLTSGDRKHSQIFSGGMAKDDGKGHTRLLSKAMRVVHLKRRPLHGENTTHLNLFAGAESGRPSLWELLRWFAIQENGLVGHWAYISTYSVFIVIGNGKN